MEKRELGRAGEDAAADYLRRLGWHILDRNWRCPVGELDIVACEPGTPQVVVFCEVKCRSGLGFGPPLEAITYAKQRKLQELALHWLRAQPRPVPRFRIDGIGVLLPVGGTPRISHVRGIGR
ncbi:MAG: YraN family protein [Propionicimonas sp.]|uniref:YraN family protein n=1 Tax=Propionicimonas sp. TaxID=1955623 RepID=UPI002B20EAFD|nr:YraN family protein [Propionicimonas sp.]MEA4943588.1 YraN family protein [Propionicimonas sp.]MEA5052394.1 YraN family protein [Propionicimonas sp.]MEA5119604.1 YraN family protein [Propionicimonas sp.]